MRARYDGFSGGWSGEAVITVIGSQASSKPALPSLTFRLGGELSQSVQSRDADRLYPIQGRSCRVGDLQYSGTTGTHPGAGDTGRW